MFLSPCDDSPPYSSYPNPILYEKGSGTFLFIEVYRSNRTVNEQRQGITMMVVSCLCYYKFSRSKIITEASGRSRFL